MVLLWFQPAQAAARPVTAALPPPPPSIAVEPNCGPPGPPPPPTTPTPTPTRVIVDLVVPYTIRVVGRGFAPGQSLRLVFNPGASEQASSVAADQAGALDVTIHPAPVAAGVHLVQAQAYISQFERFIPIAQAQFVVPCPKPPPGTPSITPGPETGIPAPVLNPVLTLTPSVGPPGTVAVAHGSDFPASTQVQIAWSQGILGSTTGTVTTDRNGAFTTRVLVMPHDQLGTRALTAVSVVPPGSSFMAFAYAFFLVVPGEVQPRDFSWRH